MSFKTKSADEQSASEKLKEEIVFDGKKWISATSNGSIGYGVLQTSLSVGLIPLGINTAKAAHDAFKNQDKKTGWVKTGQSAAAIITGVASGIKGITGIVAGLGLKKVAKAAQDAFTEEGSEELEATPVN